MLTVQMVIGLNRQIFQIIIALGHNNDSGVLNLSNTVDILHEKKIKLLGDGGYGNSYIVTPDMLKSDKWNQKQKGMRSSVEQGFSNVKNFKICSNTFHLAPEIQVMILSICYNLVQFNKIN
jgi:hypothetical protein